MCLDGEPDARRRCFGRVRSPRDAAGGIYGRRPGGAAARRAEATVAQAEEHSEGSFWDKLRDPEDGALDLSNWIASGQGFLPVAVPITEPAIGTGLAGAVAYFHRPPDFDPSGEPSPIPPSISFVGGAGTDNDTRAAFGGHMGIWNEGSTRYLGAVVATDANLTFYGEGGPDDVEAAWNLELAGTVQRIRFEVAPHVFVGAQYGFVSTRSRIGQAESLVDDIDLDSDLGGLGLSVSFDDRNTIFTPTAGLYAAASVTVNDEIFGSDFDYPRVELQALRYWELDPFVLGLRFETMGTGSGAPFYGLPFLGMRGVPAFRYVGRFTALAEVEPVWRITPRWSWLGFLSAGQAVLEVDDFGDADTIVAGGTGFRYLLARQQGLGVGIDAAWGPEESALYFVVGSSWRAR